jgi:molybdate transport system substrate-binding protein
MPTFAKSVHGDPLKEKRANTAGRAGVGRPILWALTVVLLLALSGVQAPAQFRDVLVFAAASLKNALDEANSLFLFENGSGVRVSYGASSALAKQIESGAPADVFISAILIGWTMWPSAS